MLQRGHHGFWSRSDHGVSGSALDRTQAITGVLRVWAARVFWTLRDLDGVVLREYASDDLNYMQARHQGDRTMPFKGGPSFKADSALRLREVLHLHGKVEASFEPGSTGLPHLSAKFEHAGKQHEIGIFEGNVTMWEGESLFECYMTDEFRSEQTLIEGFATRLNRYLSGGPWAVPDEQALPDAIKEKVRKLFHR